MNNKIEQKEGEYPSKIAMKVTDIILNREEGWSKKLELALQEYRTLIEAENRDKVIEEASALLYKWDFEKVATGHHNRLRATINGELQALKSKQCGWDCARGKTCINCDQDELSN